MIMINRMKPMSAISPTKSLQLALLGASMMMVGCGSSTTVADSPNNFSGNYSGTVGTQDGAPFPATLNLIQSSATTGTGDTAVTTVTLRGLLVINPGDRCGVSVDISEGIANNNSIIIELGSSTTQSTTGENNTVTNTTDSGDLALTASGNRLRGSLSFTPDPLPDCRKIGGAVVFQR